MKWLRITAVFVLMTLVKSGPTRNEAQDLDALSLNKIEKKDDGNLLFTLSAQTKPTSDHLILQVKEAIEKAFQSLSPTGSSESYTFENVLTQYSGKEVDIDILVNDAKDVPLDSIHIPTFKYPKFPENTLKSILINDGGSPPKQLLRLEGDMGDMTIEGGTCVSKEKTQYCSFPSSHTNYVPCYDTNGISVCDAPITADPATATKATIVDSVILSYSGDTSATIKLKFIADPSTISIQDVIINLSDSENQLFTIGETCTITGKFPGTDTQNLIILQKDDTEAWTTHSVDIKDRELYATILGDDIIEGRWNILEDESTKAPIPGTPTYKLRITKPNAMNPIEDIDVDCSNLEQTYCFGYFPITKTGDYTLIVAHQTATEGPDELGQVESMPQTKSSSSKPELAILSRHTTRHANQLMADVNICFEHLTPTEGRSFSHYEMLIINEKGQWLKHRILEEEEEEEREGRLCFTPFAINTKDFDLTEGTKVIVSQRGVDGFTVLATGQSKLL